jgi:pyridine nucleotide-disulfide oxidoreductase family protein
LKRLLLLGGGHAHVHVLQAFAAGPVPGAQVTLVSPFARQMYSGMVPGLVAGHYEVDDCVIPLQPLAQRAGVVWIESSAAAVDVARREATLADGKVLGYDVLSLDTGPVMDRDLIEGAREHALFVRPIEHFVRLWDSLRALAEQRALHVAVVGGGAAGVELALAMQHRFGESARVSLVTGGAAPLSSYRARVQQRVALTLRRERITVLEDSCARIDAEGITLGRGTRLACDAPVLALGASAPAWLSRSGLALDDHGFVATGQTLQSVSHPEVFAAGDVATRSDRAVPKSGVYAVRAGPALALNLRRRLAGGALEPHLPSARSLNLLACGRRDAIASWGGWSAQGPWVWWWKDRIDRAFIERYAVQSDATRTKPSPT